MTAPERPDVERTMGSLKDFQRATVEHVVRRLWTDEDQVKRFLVADEVGLGKTMVAKGVIARTVDHLWDVRERIDIVYICSNGQIARQNLSRLNVVGGAELKHADRLTLLPKVIGNLRDQRINFVSFTPGTSFQVGDRSGKSEERVVLYWMLARCWGIDRSSSRKWKRFFEGGTSQGNFEHQLRWFDRGQLDQELCGSLGEEIERAVGPWGEPLREELERCVDEFHNLRGKPGSDLGWRRNRLIGRLRGLVARAAVIHLEPDLVILDEFQRFKDLLDADDDGAQLANAIFDHPDAKVLLLSATPYKMYTLPDEPEGDDHYSDFSRTVRFLAGDERPNAAHVIDRGLRSMRAVLIAGGDLEEAKLARDRVEYELRKIMSRTERLSSTPDRDGMLLEMPLGGLHVTADDIRAWRTFDDVSRVIERQDVFEYWRSTPYPLNLMERGTYQLRKKFEAAADRQDPEIISALTGADGARAHGLLPWEDVRRYRLIDAGNAKMRALVHDVLDRGAWQLAWIPPSLPYYELAGPYADPELQTFTKRLVFSAWAVVPKAIATIVSYAAERRAMAAAGHTDRAYDEPRRTPPLQFRMDKTGERAAGMPALALMYPCLLLARLGDPLSIMRALSAEQPPPVETILDVIRSNIADSLRHLPPGLDSGRVDERWYWAAPLLLDRVVESEFNGPFLDAWRRWGGRDVDDRESHLSTHMAVADRVEELELGTQPDDLVDVLAHIALGGPGVVALRSLARVAPVGDAVADPRVRIRAFEVAGGLRSFFNKPEIVALLRSRDADAYWMSVLEHTVDGCLQAVLDEYAHVLVESEGLQDAGTDRRAEVIAQVMVEAMTTRTTANTIEHVDTSGGQLRLEPHGIRSHFAARFGRAESSDATAVRETSVRTAFNSPFRPFVLASTSVGQEGLDFHTYSHAIMHWNLPGNPVDLEQREGRVHRYKGHAVRKNVAAEYWYAAVAGDQDPWEAVFTAAQADRAPGESDIRPYWVFTRPGGAVIERTVPAMPLSRELLRYRRLLRTVGAYRLVMGQPRQDDLVRYLGDSVGDLDWMRIDLTPPLADGRVAT